ncbi:hypothetical protein J5N58_12070 [Rhizobium cremeum]|uniref:hypothetical protein n=1 Tax=Rhizobium cremeum TaxID=2813827 RepID=UPI001FD407F7|nr:hypothetical protein [Rhizobium cremeum]MCJ7994590.1 hypothetical protein [Rhizobium cremeum]MCJ8000413.1 hypothetical protein [Rhizobium cremeum]
MTEVTINDMSPEELAALTAQYEKQVPQISQKTVPTGFVGMEHHVEIKNGKQIVTKQVNHTAYANPGLAPGRVMIGGIETDIESAIASGLMTRDQAAQGFQQPAQSSGVQSDAKGIEAGQQQDQQDKPSPVSEEARQAKEASDTLNALDATIGAAAVDAALAEVVDSGYIPEDGSLPEGVTIADVIKVHAGYVAQANHQLAEVGASVDMLMDFCNSDELRDARQATIHGSHDRLREIGRAAVERLATLPQSDPDQFAERLEGMTKAERACLRQHKNSGEWIVSIPGKPEMSFGAAVRMGLVRL